VSGGVGAEAQAQFSRETPIVKAIRKTQAGVASLKVEKRGSWGRKESVGSGVIVDERGYVLTNRHVIAGADVITVRLFDNTELPGRVIVEDARHDLAILRIQAPRKLQALTLGPASDLMVGETVIAVGHPFGYTNTVSTGIISALGREVSLPGGELLNINGEVIGINVALREGAQGIAFALNADVVQQVLSRHLSASRQANLWHGLACVERVWPDGPARQQVLLQESVSTFALQAGLKLGDHIIRVGEQAVSNRFDVERALWERKAGDTVPVTIARQGKVMTISLPLGKASDAGKK
jgi:serine protease Do